MSLKTSPRFAEEYFSSISPLAKRITSDIAAVRESYEDAWNSLSVTDQKQVVDETLIFPEAVLKYAMYPSEKPDYECYPKLQLRTGEKYVYDDDKGGAWRDEYSTPFAWETQSQLDFQLFDDKEKRSEPRVHQPKSPAKIPKRREVDEFDHPAVVLGGTSQKFLAELNQKLKFPSPPSQHDDGFMAKLRNKTAVLKMPLKAVSNKEENNIHLQDTSPSPHKKFMKPKAPPPPPPKPAKAAEVKKIVISAPLPPPVSAPPEIPTRLSGLLDDWNDLNIDLSSSAQTKDIPKTGFEFLDNW